MHIHRDIVAAARVAYGKDKHLVKWYCSRRIPLLCDARVVGFVTPHFERWGWRHGPMFILPEYRGRGLVERYYSEHPERLCVAFVEHTNQASFRMHARAGFRFWRRHPTGIYMRREPLMVANVA